MHIFFIFLVVVAITSGEMETVTMEVETSGRECKGVEELEKELNFLKMKMESRFEDIEAKAESMKTKLEAKTQNIEKDVEVKTENIVKDFEAITRNIKQKVESNTNMNRKARYSIEDRLSYLEEMDQLKQGAY